MLKVLTGLDNGYTIARLASISHEVYIASCELTYDANYVTKYSFGYPKHNGENVGLLIDTDSMYYGYLADVHKARLVNIVDGDGWNDSVSEEV